MGMGADLMKIEIDRRNAKQQIYNLSFAGCGFLGVYHIGVACAVKEYAPHLLNGKISGASAGSVAAVALVCNICLGKLVVFHL